MTIYQLVYTIEWEEWSIKGQLFMEKADAEREARHKRKQPGIESCEVVSVWVNPF